MKRMRMEMESWYTNHQIVFTEALLYNLRFYYISLDASEVSKISILDQNKDGVVSEDEIKVSERYIL